MHTTSNILQWEVRGSVMIVTPQRSISSLIDDGVLPELEQLLAELQRRRLVHVVVDFDKVEYFGSSMLEALRLLWRQVRTEDGRMVLCNVPSVGLEVLRVAHYEQLWEVYPSRASALRGLGIRD